MTRATTSASNLFRRALCPASHHLEHGMPDEENDVSKMGTLGHLHFADKKRDRSALTEDLQRCLRIGDEEELAFYARVESEEGLSGEEYESDAEREMWFFDPLGNKLVPGHCDGWRWYPEKRVLAIPDLKLGYIPVTTAESNWQIAAYGCMGRHLTDCAVFYGGIIQPRLAREKRLTIGRYDAAALDLAVVEITKTFGNAVRAKFERGNPGELQCRNCKGKLRCEAFIERVRSLIPSLPQPLSKKDVPFAIEPLSDAEFGDLGDNIKFAAMIGDAWKAEAIRRITAGQLPGWQIEPGNLRKVVDDALAAYNLALEVCPGLEDRDFMAAVGNLSFDKLKVPVAKRLGIPQTQAKFRLQEALAEVIVEKQNAPSVTRI